MSVKPSLFKILLVLLLATFAAPDAEAKDTGFAVIGDYGMDGADEARVAQLVKSWTPAFVLTVGDNNYESGSAATIDRNVGKHYQEFIYPYRGKFGAGSLDQINRFFPTLGNHDWRTKGAKPYLDYFTLPGNERYYDFTWGAMQFFALDSDPREPDGNHRNSRQARWLKEKLQASTARFKIVYFHHPPYSSASRHGDAAIMQWPFDDWGADAVLSGHEHVYERLVVNDVVYFINGVGGYHLYDFTADPRKDSQFRYAKDYGAMRGRLEENDRRLTFEFYSVSDGLLDSHTLRKN